MNKIAIVGVGTMGSGIGYVTAMAGYQTRHYDLDAGMLEKARAYHRSLIDRAVEKGRVTLEEADAYWGRTVYTDDLAAALNGVDLVIEAVPEMMAL